MITKHLTTLCLLLAFHTISAQSFCTKYFDMQNAVLVSGTDRQEGAIYKFSSAAPGIDVYIRIEKMFNAYVAVFDRTDLGYTYAWQPHIPSTSAAGGYVDWTISFKVAGTNRDTTACPSFTAIDIDGTTGVREYVESVGYTNYNTLTPTALTIQTGSAGYSMKALGVETAYDGISTTEKSVMIQFNYNNISSFKYRTGVQGLAEESSGRYFSLHFTNYLTCDNFTNGGAIGVNESSCGAFNPETIVSSSSPTGGSGAIEYQWLYNTTSSDPLNSNWQVIPNSNYATYDPMPISVTTNYMRQVRRENCAQWVSSNVVSKTVTPAPTITVSASASVICPDGSVKLTATVSPMNMYTYQWQKSTDNINWTNIVGANGATRNETNITGEVYYRAYISVSGCTPYSSSVKVSTYDTTPPVLTGVPADVTVPCTAIPPMAIPNATDNCQIKDIVLHESYSSCLNPALNTNGGIENVGNIAMDATFMGYPAKKLPNYATGLAGWEMGFPAGSTDPALLVHDNNNTINNPEGNYFMWVPGNSYCVINNPINLQAGQCVEISMWAAALSNINPQQGTRIQVEVFRVSDNAFFQPYYQVLPASVSIQNMNWQRIVTQFVTPAAGAYKFVITQEVDPVYGPTPKGFALDGFEVKNCCTTAPSNCKNYTITRTWTARDEAGNATKQTQTITVQDTEAPVFNNIPANATYCVNVPAVPTITATDNCDANPVVVLKSEINSKTTDGSCTDNFYFIKRTWTATDACGNKITASQIITIVGQPTVAISETPFCTGGTTTLTASTGSCGPTADFQWQQKIGNNWTNVGTNSPNFTTAALTANTEFRVTATYPGTTCSATSTTYIAKPAAPLAVSLIEPSSSVCVGSNTVLTANTTGGAGTFTYKWERSTDNTNWAVVAGETTETYKVPTGVAGTFYFKVSVTASGSNCGSAAASSVKVVVANSAGCDCVLQDCSAYTKLIYKNPVVVTDVPNTLVGDKWRFNNVATGYDAIVEIVNAVNANSLNSIDNTAVNVDDWCPEINFNFLAGQDSYLDWKITIVAAGTNTPANLPTSSRVTSYDVDGNNNYREIHGHINSNGYILNNPTELAILNESPFSIVLGSNLEHTSISTHPEVKATFYYPGQNNIFNIRLGVRTTVASGAAFRQFAVSFDPCVSYSNPNVTPQLPEIAGVNATCVGGANETYTTTQPFTSYNWEVTGGTIISGQGTRTITVDWTSTGNKTVKISTIDANGCAGSFTYAVTVNDDPSVTAVSSNNKSLVCKNSAVVLTANVIGGAGTKTYQWQSKIGNGNWADISGATNLTYPVPTNTVGITQYQVVVSFENSGCSSASNAVPSTVEVIDAITITAQPIGFIECLGGTQTLTAMTTGGKNLTYQWYSSTDNVTWTKINGETGVTYTPLSTSVGKTHYKVTIKSSGSDCGEITTDPTVVEIIGKPTVSISALSSEAICEGNTLLLTANVTGGTGTPKFQWQQKIAGVWTNVGTVASTYTTTNLSADTDYKVILTQTGGGCDATSADFTVKVVSKPTVEIKTTTGQTNPSICTGSGVTLKATVTGGSGTASYQWLQNIGGVWTNVGTNASNYTTNALKADTDFKVIITQTGGGCGVTSSDFKVKVVAGPTVTVSSSSNSEIVCKNAPVTLTANVTGGAGTKKYQWQSKVGSGNWTDISGATNLTYPVPTNTVGITQYQVVVSFENSGCSSASNAVPSTVEVIDAITITAQPIGFIECLGGTQTLTAMTTGGKNLTYQWYSSTDNVTWTKINGETGVTYTPLSTSVGKTHYKVTIKSSGTDCGEITTDPTVVEIVNKPIVKVTLDNSDPICEGGSVILNANVTDNSASCTIQWQSKLGVGAWENIQGANGTSYKAQSLNSTTRYRVTLICSGNGCCN